MKTPNSRIGHGFICFWFALLLGLLSPPVYGQDFILNIDHGRMDARIEGVSMQQVMERISKDIGILVFLDPSLLSDPLSVQFQGLPVEQGLKKIVGEYSYAMVFSAEVHGRGGHPVKAIRVYPKGQPEADRYVFLNPADRRERKPGSPVVMSAQEVNALLKKNEQTTLSHVAQQISQRKNSRELGDTPGDRSLVHRTLQRARRVRELKELKARTLARKRAFETKRSMQFQEQQASQAGRVWTSRREAAVKSGQSTNVVN